MKYLLILCLVSFLEICGAQPKVLFDYDAAGNRIMRYMVSSLSTSGGETDEVGFLEAVVDFDNKGKFVAGEINISPNPTTNMVRIEISTEIIEPAEIHLYDSRGQILHTSAAVLQLAQFDISHLSAGTYYCHIATQSKAGIWKIVKAN